MRLNFKFDLQLFGGGGGTTVNQQSYTPSAYELQLQKAQADYADAVAPNSLWLNDTAKGILQNSLGAVQVDFNKLNNVAQQQIAGANAGYNALAKGELPAAYTDNMTKAIQSSVKNSFGQVLNDVANRGVINSSVTNQGLNDISKNASDSVAQNYLNNVNAFGIITL